MKWWSKLKMQHEIRRIQNRLRELSFCIACGAQVSGLSQSSYCTSCQGQMNYKEGKALIERLKKLQGESW